MSKDIFIFKVVTFVSSIMIPATEHLPDVCLLSQRGNVGTPYPNHYSPAFASSSISNPHTRQLPSRFAFPKKQPWEMYGVSTFRPVEYVG